MFGEHHGQVWVLFSLSDADLGLVADCDTGSDPRTRYCPEVTQDTVWGTHV